MICIDGSTGEGGGQVLRSSLSLAAITGEEVRFDRLRAGRKNPGLAAQHLTSVKAAAAICQAEVRGDRLGSTWLEFIPGGSVRSGNYAFDVGTAGAVSLILQTILLPLALTAGDSTIILRGGTWVIFSPCFSYIEQVYLPILARMGVKAEVILRAWGWYPRGGGELELRVKGGQVLQGINLLEKGKFHQVKGLALVTELPAHIPNRMAHRSENILREANLRCLVKPVREKGIAPGAGIFLMAEYEHCLAGFSALGKLGLPGDKVAEMACNELLDFHQNTAPVDVHLADQLLLPAALALSESKYKVAEVSLHLTTNAWVIAQFGIAAISINENEGLVSVVPNHGKS